MDKSLYLDGKVLTVKELKEFLNDVPDDYIVTGGTLREWDFGGNLDSIDVFTYNDKNMVNFTLLKLY